MNTMFLWIKDKKIPEESVFRGGALLLSDPLLSLLLCC
jgi:hypothetical protein